MMLHMLSPLGRNVCGRSILTWSRTIYYKRQAILLAQNMGCYSSDSRKSIGKCNQNKTFSRDHPKKRDREKEFRPLFKKRQFTEKELEEERLYRESSSVTAQSDRFGIGMDACFVEGSLEGYKKAERSSEEKRKSNLRTGTSQRSRLLINERIGTNAKTMKNLHDLTNKEENEIDLHQKTESMQENRSVFPTQRKKQSNAATKKQKRDRQTALPDKWSETFGSLSLDDEDFDSEQSSFSSVGSHNERYGDEMINELSKHDDIYHHVRLARYNRKHVPTWYARRIDKLGSQGKIREAIEVFDKWMIKEDRVKPTGFEFGVLITLLGHVGYTKKAFQLYNQMNKMGIYVDKRIYTSLFNACQNSPWPEDGLSRANKLRERMLVTRNQPTFITYMAMISAFGFCGDINMAFRLADEVAHLYREPNENLLNSLLCACVSDKDAGFRHAILGWRKCIKLGIKPGLTSYNVLLRAVAECGIGDPGLVEQLLVKNQSAGPAGENTITDKGEVMEIEASEKNSNKFNNRKRNKKSKKVRHKQLESFNEIDLFLSRYVTHLEETIDEINETDKPLSLDMSHIEIENQESVINKSDNNDIQGEKTSADGEQKDTSMMAVDDDLNWWQLVDDSSNASVTDIATIQNSAQQLDGGVKNSTNLPNILDPNENLTNVLSLKCIETKEDRFALLGGLSKFLASIEKDGVKPDIVTFTELLLCVPAKYENIVHDVMQVAGVKPDIDFYNHLMHKRCMRKDHNEARNVMEMIHEDELVPNLWTYANLALTCKKRTDGLELVSNMLDADLMPNMVIMGSLMWASHCNFLYKKNLLEIMQRLDIKPNRHFIKKLEHQIAFARITIAKKDRGLKVFPFCQSDVFNKSFNHFVMFYDTWSKHMAVEQAEDPWQEFRTVKTPAS